MRLDLNVEDLKGTGARIRLRRPLLFMVGFAGRDRAAVQHHIEELGREGVPAPDKVPAYYRVPGYMLVGSGEYDVLGPRTSGEIEPVLLVTSDGMFVGVGSDHTDREAERRSVPLSKQLGPKVLAGTVWPLGEVEGHWDDLVLMGWSGGRSYQQGRLAELLPYGAHPLETMHASDRDLVLFLGTLPVVGGNMDFSEEFSGELRDLTHNRSITFAYKATPLPS